MGLSTMVSTVTLTILAPEVMANHPELHHYTSEKGLRGILESQALWATNYGDLNDSSEMTHLREPLRPVMIGRFREILAQKRQASMRINKAIEQSGGIIKCATDLADDLIRSFYESTFEPMGQGPASATSGVPYITSFCTHSQDEYERENGLLSQWRGYGGSAGFCLVFDTIQLGELLGQEFDRFAYTHLNLAPAHYALPSLSIPEVFPGLVVSCDNFIEAALAQKPALNDGIAEFFAAATLVKHQAFREEREVRVVAIPIAPRMRELIAQENAEALRDSRPEVSGPKRHIELLASSGRPLPIRRLIVGPSQAQDDHVRIAEALAAGRFPVVRSMTPFKG